MYTPLPFRHLAVWGEDLRRTLLDQPRLGFAFPVEKKRRRRDDEDPPERRERGHDAQGLDGLPQAHLVPDERPPTHEGVFDPCLLEREIGLPFRNGVPFRAFCRL